MLHCLGCGAAIDEIIALGLFVVKDYGTVGDYSRGRYDLDEFERLTDGGVLEVFLKGHLWLERCLNEFLEIAAKEPQPLRIDRMSFSMKVNLCEAFGLVPSPICVSFRSANRIRNQLAHNLDAKISEDVFDELLEHTPGKVLAGYKAVVGVMENPDTLIGALVGDPQADVNRLTSRVENVFPGICPLGWG